MQTEYDQRDAVRANSSEKKRILILGGGFAGTESAGSVNDFIQEAMKFYPRVTKDLPRVVLVHPGEVILPELGESLGRYAQKKLGPAHGAAPRPFRFKILDRAARRGGGDSRHEVLRDCRVVVVARHLSEQAAGFSEKVRVAIDWALGLIFSKDLVQVPTLRSAAISEPEKKSTDVDASSKL